MSIKQNPEKKYLATVITGLIVTSVAIAWFFYIQHTISTVSKDMLPGLPLIYDIPLFIAGLSTIIIGLEQKRRYQKKNNLATSLATSISSVLILLIVAVVAWVIHGILYGS